MNQVISDVPYTQLFPATDLLLFQENFSFNSPLSILRQFLLVYLHETILFYSIFKYFVNHFFTINSAAMAYNVSAVHDVFAVAIKECGAFQQPQKCGGEKPHKGRKPDCGFS
jgi:hypothetical protein